MEKPWRQMFPESVINKAQEAIRANKVSDVTREWGAAIVVRYYPDDAELKADGVRGKAYKRAGYYSDYYADSYGLYTDEKGDRYYKVSGFSSPTSLKEEWNPRWIECSCLKSQSGQMCVHKAALMLVWEKKLGGMFIAQEDDYSFRKRKIKIEQDEHVKAQKALRTKYGTDEVPAAEFFRDRKENRSAYLYDIRRALEKEGRVTNGYCMHMAREILDKETKGEDFEEEVLRSGRRYIIGNVILKDCVTKEEYLAAKALIEGDKLKVTSSEGYLDSRENIGSMWGKNHDTYIEDCGKFLNINALVAISIMWDEADKYMDAAKDFTDDNAGKFFKSLEKANTAAVERAEIPEEPRKKNISLYPRIIIEDGNAQLSFRIEQAGSKVMVVKNMNELVGCYTDRTVYTLSKTTSIDFCAADFTDDSMSLYQFIQRRIGEVHDANAKIELRNSNRTFNTLSVTSAFDFKGALLDGFYDAWDGHLSEYTDKTNGIKSVQIPVGHRDLRFALTAKKIEDTRGTFCGVAVEGLLPVLMNGSGKNRYVLNSTGLSRVTSDEVDQLAPFLSIADASGFFRFQVGMDHLQEFYYRVVPSFVDSPMVQFKDECAEEAEQYLPPEPQFDFWLDCVALSDDKLETCQSEVQSAFKIEKRRDGDKQYLLTIRTEVSYEDKPAKSVLVMADREGKGTSLSAGTGRTVEVLPVQDTGKGASPAAKKDVPAIKNAPVREPAPTVRSYTLGERYTEKNKYRDTAQEGRVEKAVRSLAPNFFLSLRAFGSFLTDDELFDFMRSGISVLERFGSVHGTDAFRRHAVRPVPQVKIGVSVDSGVMDLSLTSQDLSREELLDVLKSYRLKKRFHKLSSGDFLDLTQQNQLQEVGEMLAGLNLSPEEVIEKSAKLPLYRALYLDQLLEEHEDIASSRDRVYRALIRNFRTVKDSEIEPPASLENVLRPYQQYGFKWLKTLENAGFGGILADEMGLGKTLQMISVLLSDYKPDESSEKQKGKRDSAEVKDADKLAPSLIVCPASLVYNWQEEFSRFAPVLSVLPVAGGTAARKKAWEAWDTTQVYIISYDLLKRHIAEIAPKSFDFVVLDEAQYIKNAGAAVSKSVKALKAAHRFALTGTPIENRLSELWSIFDFLMPGFLYTHTEFEKNLETPITKQKDEAATKKLRSMTGPFILRRKKEDVLKDLPEKLEEVRYVPIRGEQEKLYNAQVVKIKKAIKDSDTTGADGKAEGSRIQVFAELTRIREICCDPSLVYEDYHGESAKRDACLSLIRQAIDGGHRMLVFSQFTSMLALLEEDLKNAGIPYYLLTGATSKEKRIELVHDFNEGDVPVFLISLKAGGTGLNLTGADVVIHYDPWWNLAAQNQATDRTHRIGQTKQVTVYRLIMKGTIEDRILEMQESKKDLADSVLEGDNRSLSSLSSEELLELLG